MAGQAAEQRLLVATLGQAGNRRLLGQELGDD